MSYSEAATDDPASETRDSLYARLDEAFAANPKANRNQLSEIVGCQLTKVAEWKKTRGLASTHKRAAPPGQVGYYTQCPNCLTWFWTKWKRRVYHTRECFNEINSTPVHKFLKKLGTSDEIGEATGVTGRLVRMWYHKGIREDLMDAVIKLARKKAMIVSKAHLHALNAETIKRASYRPRSRQPGRTPAETVSLVFEQEPRASRWLEVITPTELQMAQLLRMLDNQGHFILDKRLAQQMRDAGWIQLGPDDLWHVTEHGTDAVLYSDVKEYAEARAARLAAKQAKKDRSNGNG